MHTGLTVDLMSGFWKLEEQLGQDGYGEVYRGRRGEEQAAIKFVSKDKGRC